MAEHPGKEPVISSQANPIIQAGQAIKPLTGLFFYNLLSALIIAQPDNYKCNRLQKKDILHNLSERIPDLLRN